MIPDLKTMHEQILYGSHNIEISVRKKKIQELKKQFDTTDYQTTKNLQYEKMGKELPYKWEDIDAQAEYLRTEINKLENEIQHLLQINYKPIEMPTIK